MERRRGFVHKKIIKSGKVHIEFREQVNLLVGRINVRVYVKVRGPRRVVWAVEGTEFGVTSFGV